MTKRMLTRLYIGGFVVFLIAVVGLIASLQYMPMGLLAIAGIVITLVAWIGALVRLAQQKAWGWFVRVLVGHLVALGIAWMIAIAATYLALTSVWSHSGPGPV